MPAAHPPGSAPLALWALCFGAPSPRETRATALRRPLGSALHALRALCIGRACTGARRYFRSPPQSLAHDRNLSRLYALKYANAGPLSSSSDTLPDSEWAGTGAAGDAVQLFLHACMT